MYAVSVLHQNLVLLHRAIPTLPTDIFDQHKSHIVSQIFRSGIWDPKSKSGSKWEMCEVYEKPEERLQPKILIRGLRDHPSSMIHQSFIKSSCITSIFQFLLIKNYFSWRTIPSHIICSYVATNIMYGCMDPRIFCPPMSRVPFCQCQLPAVWSISTMSPHQTIRHPAMFPLTSKETIKDDGQTDKKEKTKK